MNYCFVSGNYPTENRQVHVFLENLVVELVERGELCTVIAPQSYVAYYLKKGIKRDIVSERTTKTGKKYMVYSPLYLLVPKLKLGRLSLVDLQRWIFYRALKKIYKKYKIKADIVYSHFVRIGMSGVMLAKDIGVPSFIANGEADTYAEIRLNSEKMIIKTLKNVTGIISVSSKNKQEIMKLSKNDANVLNKVTVISNAVDTNRFYSKDKKEIRKKMGWPIDAFIVAFTGSFIERKGVMRLSHALDRFDDVYSIFMGVGDERPNCKNILHCGRVNNAELCDYLNAADVFVLPTQAEGCSNAIVEAVASGLPVISSDLPFNYDILDETCSILIDPNDEDAIASAIRKLKDDRKLREKLEEGAKLKAESLSLKVRVDKIQGFISSRMENT